MNRYFLRPWRETRGDEYSHWGHSRWYFEADSSGRVRRQLEQYDAGPRLGYHEDHPEDELGSLSAEPLDLDAVAPFEVDRHTFEIAWNAGPFDNESAA